jgi:two-component system phosphate regulon sensor histidine kinase PhoR
LSLRARLLVVPALIVVAAVALLTVLEHADQRRWLITHESDVLGRTLREVARTAAPAPDAGATANGWQLYADSLDARLDVRVTVIARDGRVLADSRAQASTMENHAGREEVSAALRGGMGFGVRRSATLGIEFLYCAVPLARPDAAVLRLAEPLVVVERMSETLTRLSVTAASVALLASILVLAYVSARFARRLRRLQRVARGIGLGEAEARATEAPDDDLGKLGRALNEMHGELDSRLEALRRERDDRELILAHMSDGVALIDGTDHVVHVNHRFAELLDAPLRPGPGTLFTAFTRVPELAEIAAAARRTGRTVERELKPWTTRTRTARATATPLGSTTPGPVLLVLHDLSESEALQRMRQDFVANVSHELRTPLTSLRGYAETLLEGGLEDAEHRESFVRVMRDQAVRLQALVEDLLSLSEMERPDATLRREPLDLHALAAEQVAQVREAATRAGLELSLEGTPPVRVVGDRVRLTQVLANLLDNAVKYTEHGSVTVAVGEAHGRAWCEVRDTGPGIPAEDLPRVFERFYRVDKARSREKGGTGLGLAIVKHAVALHDGVVAVESRVGEGTTFRFEIPATPPR